MLAVTNCWQRRDNFCIERIITYKRDLRDQSFRHPRNFIEKMQFCFQEHFGSASRARGVSRQVCYRPQALHASNRLHQTLNQCQLYKSYGLLMHVNDSIMHWLLQPLAPFARSKHFVFAIWIHVTSFNPFNSLIDLKYTIYDYSLRCFHSNK